MEWSALKPLEQSFYHRRTTKVAMELLGCLLIRQLDDHVLVGKIVETEAYVQNDPACHAYSNFLRMQEGKRPQGRSAILFGPPGYAYVYLNYGIHWLFNVVTEGEGTAGAVLIRALEPVAGLDVMRAHRPKTAAEYQLTNGPGKLTQALNIGPAFNGVSLLASPLFIARQPNEKIAKQHIHSTVRIGISKAIDKPWRYLITDNPYVSAAK